VYEHQNAAATTTTPSVRRGPHLHSGYERAATTAIKKMYNREGGGERGDIRNGPPSPPAPILYQLLRLLNVPVRQEEFHCTKTLDLAAANDATWSRICQAMGWKFNPTV
jgi:hypothetical protein